MSERAQKRKASDGEVEEEADEEDDVIGPLPVEATKPSRKKRGLQTASRS